MTPRKRRAAARRRAAADVFQTNPVEILDRPVAGLGVAGDLLVSLGQLDLVAVIDPRASAIRWRWGPGQLDRQHQPSVTPRGTVLIFDNGRHRRWSRAVEVDPLSGAIVWQYHGDPPETFYSFSRGGAQRLPNGNTLITALGRRQRAEESPTPRRRRGSPPARGRRRSRDQPPRRAALYRLRRLPEGWPQTE